MVGMHPNSPQNPHSAPASGGDNIGDIRNDPPVPAHVLYGAVVGGPLENDQFWDWRDDWVQTEVRCLRCMCGHQLTIRLRLIITRTFLSSLQCRYVAFREFAQLTNVAAQEQH